MSPISKFSRTYPSEATLKEYLNCLESIKGASNCKEIDKLAVSIQFFAKKERFRLGGLLLPYLIEFYQWLHEEITHQVAIDDNLSKDIGKVVKELTSRYPEKEAKRVEKLFNNVRGVTGFLFMSCN